MRTSKRSASDLTNRVRFQRRTEDANGDPLGPWETVASSATDAAWAAQIIRLKGGEPVMAQRLQGVQPVMIAVRASSVTRQVNNAWRATDARTGQVYEIADAGETDDRAWVEILATAKAEDKV